MGKIIYKFEKEYRFLSNFYESPVLYTGITFQSAEAAYQSAKTLDKELIETFRNSNPSEAKKLGRTVKLRDDWERIKRDVMYDVVYSKFSRVDTLKKKLIATEDAQLIEGNTWGDAIWGMVIKPDGTMDGLNMLGDILQQVRYALGGNP